MKKKELVKMLWEERRIHVMTPSKLRIVRQSSKLVEVYYSGKLHVDEIDKKFAVKID